MRKRIFIGSSTEALHISYAVQENLEHVSDVTVWTQDIFKPSRYTLEDLEEALDSFDYGVFVFSEDDVILLREHTYTAARDNVVFEFGLFVGHLGRENCFFLAPRSCPDLHLPSDLAGLTPLTYATDRSDNNLAAAIGPACNKIQKEIASAYSDVIASARTQYDILTNKYPSRRSVRYLDTACVFNSRTMFDSCVSYERLFNGAKSVRALGISLNAITINWGMRNLVSLARCGCEVSLLFLDPTGKSTALREEVEQLPPSSIGNVTNINIALVCKAQITLGEASSNLKFKVYEDTPSLNMYIINEQIIVFQHYLAGRAGQECPVFVLRNEHNDGGLFEAYIETFDATWRKGWSPQ